MALKTFRKSLSFFWRFQKMRFRSWALKKFGSSAELIAVRTRDDTWFLVDPADGHVSRQLLKSGQYNPLELERIIKLIRPIDTMLLVGAHVGALALPLSRFVNQLELVEANPKTFQILKANVRLSGQENIGVQSFAATDGTSSVTFRLALDNSGGSKQAPVIDQMDYRYDVLEEVEIPGAALDERYNNDFDIVFMDIEGGEFGAIQGAQRILSKARVFIVEYMPDHVELVAGKTIEEWVELLIGLNFDRVQFPKLGVSGHPKDCLLDACYQVKHRRETEDGIIFSRLSGSPECERR